MLTVQISNDSLDIGHSYQGDAGLDLRTTTPLDVPPRNDALWTKLVDTGTRVAIPEGYCGLVVIRSGLAKQGMTLGNGVGVIDSGYRDSIKLLMTNEFVERTLHFVAGSRVAQLVIVSAPVIDLVRVDELDSSERGLRGFGSSGDY